MAPPSRFALAALPQERRITASAVAAAWLGQLALGLVLAQLVPVPQRPLLLDRHACDAAGWRALVERYRGLHWQHLLQQQRFGPVLESSVFGLRLHPQPPSPDSLVALAVLGEGEAAGAAALRRRYPAALVLACGPGDGAGP